MDYNQLHSQLQFEIRKTLELADQIQFDRQRYSKILQEQEHLLKQPVVQQKSDIKVVKFELLIEQAARAKQQLELDQLHKQYNRTMELNLQNQIEQDYKERERNHVQQQLDVQRKRLLNIEQEVDSITMKIDQDLSGGLSKLDQSIYETKHNIDSLKYQLSATKQSIQEYKQWVPQLQDKNDQMEKQKVILLQKQDNLSEVKNKLNICANQKNSLQKQQQDLIKEKQRLSQYCQEQKQITKKTKQSIQKQKQQLQNTIQNSIENGKEQIFYQNKNQILSAISIVQNL